MDIQKEKFIILETEFSSKVKISTSAEYENKSFDEKVAELTKMYAAGRRIRDIIDNKNINFTEEERKQYWSRLMTGFQQINKLITALANQVSNDKKEAIDAIKAKGVTGVPIRPRTTSQEPASSVNAGMNESATVQSRVTIKYIKEGKEYNGVVKVNDVKAATITEAAIKKYGTGIGVIL